MPSRYGSIARTFLIAACLSCSSNNSPQAGGDTHWLSACTHDHECGELACLCGICTRRCSQDSACRGEVEAACFDSRSPALLQRCEAEGAAATGGVCLAECATGSECGDRQTCMHGVCLRQDVVEPDAGASDVMSTPEPPLRTSDFDDVSADVPWAEPVAKPRPEAAVTGTGVDQIVGTWIEPGCDPSLGTEAGVGGTWPRFEGCARLVIARTASGEITGSLFFDRTFDAVGPFAPATDPNVGYPVEVDPSQYFELREWQPQVPYRMLDGRFEDGRLTFWSSSIDLWHDWCALQVPHPWDAGDHVVYACVPQDVQAQATIDEGKIVLCRSPELEPSCGPPGGPPEPCWCQGTVSDQPRCVGGYCRCDALGCEANVQYLSLAAELTLEEGRLTGSAYGGLVDYDFTMERETP